MIEVCRHASTHFLEEEWPTGEAIEVCELCGMSRAHWEEGESPWTLIEDIEAARRELEIELANPLPNTISYVCACGHTMVVSVGKVDQKRDETRTCEECGEEAPWDELTVDGPDDPFWRKRE